MPPWPHQPDRQGVDLVSVNGQCLRGAGGRDGMILISGEALIDLIPDPEKAAAYDAVLGGSPYNVAIGLGGWERRPPSSPAYRRTATATRWPVAFATMASTFPLSRATIARRRSPSSCAEPRRPDRATLSIWTEQRTTALGRSRKNGPPPQGTCTSVLSPRSTRHGESVAGAHEERRAHMQRSATIRTSAPW